VHTSSKGHSKANRPYGYRIREGVPWVSPSENRKDKLADDLARFYRYKHIPFDKARHRRMEQLPFIPQESEIDQLISSMGKKMATFLQLLKETGIRAGEA